MASLSKVVSASKGFIQKFIQEIEEVKKMSSTAVIKQKFVEVKELHLFLKEIADPHSSWRNPLVTGECTVVKETSFYSEVKKREVEKRNVRVISAEGKQLGIFLTSEAIRKAEDQGLDLVEISPKAKPPVCKIIDYGKFLYQQTKREREQKKGSVQTMVVVNQIMEKILQSPYLCKQGCQEEKAAVETVDAKEIARKQHVQLKELIESFLKLSIFEEKVDAVSSGDACVVYEEEKLILKAQYKFIELLGEMFDCRKKAAVGN